MNAQTPIQFPKNLIFVSPHYDDTLLTFAGLIENYAGFTSHNIQSLLIFSRSQWTTDNPNPNDLSHERINRVSVQRYLEDYAAMSDLFKNRARMESYGYPEAPIRCYKGPVTAGGGPSGDFSTFAAPEIEIYNELIPIFERKLLIPDSAMFVLMANGYHIDHFIVREAVLAAARNLGNKARCIIYFGEDQPYTGANPQESIQQMLSFQQRLNLQKISYKINHTTKINMFTKYYKSQYHADYKAGIESWALINDANEDIFLWQPENYAVAPDDPTWNASICR